MGDFLGPAITNVNAFSRKVLPTLKGDNHWLLSVPLTALSPCSSTHTHTI